MTKKRFGVDILDEDGCVIGRAYALTLGCNDRFVALIEYLNQLTKYETDCEYFCPEDLETYKENENA